MEEEEGMTLWEYMWRKKNYPQTQSYTQEDESNIAQTHGQMRPCPYCGSNDIRTYADGTADCESCGREYRYAY